MKKPILLFSLFFCLFTSAQNYNRVLIKNGTFLVPELLQSGIDLDHGRHQNTDLILEISDYDLSLIQQNQIDHQVMITDLENYYAERFRTSVSQKSSSTGSCKPSKIITPSHFHLGSMGGSFTFQEMLNQLDSMVLLYPSLITVKQPVSNIQSVEGRDIWFVKISDNPSSDENEAEVLYTALHHAREGGSLMQMIFYMWYLLENYSSDPSIQALVNNRELFFVPCVNPDGYYFNEQNNPGGGGMWRKNRRVNADNSYGVDLNRNYGFNWGFDNQGSSPNPPSDTYRGTSAFSEPETQAMQAFCNSRQFKTALNSHTFGNFLIVPWGFQQNGNSPDSNQFKSFGDYLTRENRYYHGSSMQTVNYAVNGNSDDWMYGEQVTKGKIMAMTPEMGGPNDGFWPQSFRIVDICKSAFEQNLRLARIAGPHVAFVDEQDRFVSANSYLRFSLKDMGLQPGTATISLSPVSGILSFGAAKSFTFLSGQSLIDSISFISQTGLQAGQVLRYAVQVNDGSLLFRDTLEKIMGPAQTLFYSNGSASPASFVTAGWGFSSQDAFTAPSSWSDSPFGPYQGGISNDLTITNNISLIGKQKAHLQFHLRYAIEKSYDDLRILISTDQGQTYTPLCGNYATPDHTYDGQFALYDGRQIGWVKEEIDLSPYIGSNILLRWQLNSDFFDERDGAYLDEIKVRAIGGTAVDIVSPTHNDGNIDVFPNPAENELTLTGTGSEIGTGSIYNLQGILCSRKYFNSEESHRMSLEELLPGMYLLHWESKNANRIIKFIKL